MPLTGGNPASQTVQVTSSRSVPVPSWAKRCAATIVGGGGSGASGGAGGGGGGGQSSAAWVNHPIPIANVTQIDVTIGAGATAGGGVNASLIATNGVRRLSTYAGFSAVAGGAANGGAGARPYFPTNYPNAQQPAAATGGATGVGGQPSALSNLGWVSSWFPATGGCGGGGTTGNGGSFTAASTFSQVTGAPGTLVGGLGGGGAGGDNIFGPGGAGGNGNAPGQSPDAVAWGAGGGGGGGGNQLGGAGIQGYCELTFYP